MSLKSLIQRLLDSRTTAAQAGHALFTPVSKGQLFSVYGRHLEQVTVRLVKLSVGGGMTSLFGGLYYA